MGFRVLIVPCLAAAVCAEPLDVKTAVALDAEVHGEWLAAVAAYRDAIGDGKGTPLPRMRLEKVQRAAKSQADGVLRMLKKMKRDQWSVDAAAEIVRLMPNHSLATKTIEQGAKKGTKPRVARYAFPARGAVGRALAAERQGKAFLKGEKLIDEALAFLLATQKNEGHWDAKWHGGQANYDGGVTALAMLALLARDSDGLTDKTRSARDKASAYLCKEQKENGRWAMQSQHGVYVTALATEALAEYALITGKKEAVEPHLKRAVEMFKDWKSDGGGWRYDPGSESDTSVTSRVILALKRCRRLGLDVPDSTLDRGVRWVMKCLDTEWGQIGYNIKGGSPARPEGLHERFPPELSQSMTAAGAVILCEVAPDNGNLGAPIGLVRSTLPVKKVPDFYYWMEGAHCLRMAEGSLPRDWYAALVDGVAAHRKEDGSVGANGPWGPDGGIIYTTAACVLALSGPYREERRVRAMVDYVRKGVREVHVAGTSTGTPTRVFVQRGDRIKLIDHGKVTEGEMDRSAGANGFVNADRSFKRLIKRKNFACLLARVGEKGKPFAPALAEAFDVPGTGHLYFLVNDRNPSDNSGGWVIEIRSVPR
jgi:hypothetical protein